MFEADHFIADDDHVAVLGHERMPVKSTGQIVGARWVEVGRFREGSKSHFDEYSDTAHLQAVEPTVADDATRSSARGPVSNSVC